MNHIHPSALVDEGAELDENVEIGPFCVIGPGVYLGPGTRLESHVVIRRGTRLLGGNRVDAGVQLGGDPQDLSFDPGLETGLVIGRDTVIREGAVVHRSTRPETPTTIGESCYLMNHSHIGHDSQLGDHVVLAGGAMVAGFCEIGSHAVIGGTSGLHQWVRVGEGAMIGGGSRVTCDIPPFLMASERNDISGLNLLGLRRRGFGRGEISELKRCFQEVIVKGANVRKRAAELLEAGICETEAAQRFLQFFAKGKRPVGHWRPGL